MRRLILAVLAISAGILLFVILMYLVPGDEDKSGTPSNSERAKTADTNVDFPPPPPGWEGPWPPPDYDTTLDDGDDVSWYDPDDQQV